MGFDATYSQTIGVKIGRLTSEWQNFCIRTLINVIHALLEGICVLSNMNGVVLKW